MTRSALRRVLLAAAVTASAAGGLVTAGSAHAAPATAIPVDPVGVTTASGYWACLAIDHVEIGTCLENPLPRLG